MLAFSFTCKNTGILDNKVNSRYFCVSHDVGFYFGRGIRELLILSKACSVFLEVKGGKKEKQGGSNLRTQQAGRGKVVGEGRENHGWGWGVSLWLRPPLEQQKPKSEYCVGSFVKADSLVEPGPVEDGLVSQNRAL